MKSSLYVQGSSMLGLILLVLVTLLPAMAMADTANHQAVPVKAVVAGPGQALWALRGSKLYSVDDGSAVTLPLPDFGADALPSTLATAADGRLYLGGIGMGVWRYDAGNAAWTPLNETLPNLKVSAIAAHSTQPGTLYAVIPGEGILRSRDGGVEWNQVDGGPWEQIQVFVHSNMPGSMESGWLFAGTERGVARSMDCFCLWSDAGELRGNVSSVTFDLSSPENVYAVVDGQLHHSDDGGEAWVPLPAPEGLTAVTFSSTQGLVAGTAKGVLWARNASGQWQAIND